MSDPYPLLQSLYYSLGISEDSTRKEKLNAQVLWYSANHHKTYYEAALAAYDLMAIHGKRDYSSSSGEDGSISFAEIRPA